MKLLKNSMSLLPIQNLANFFEVSKSYIKAPELRKENMPILKPYPFLRYVTADKNLAFKVTSSILICHNNRRCHNMRWDLYQYHCDPTQRGFLSLPPFGRKGEGREEGYSNRGKGSSFSPFTEGSCPRARRA